MKVAVVGTGYVGLPTGTVLADIGHTVVCIDRDEKKLERIKRAESPIFEPGLNELLGKVIESGRFSVASTIKQGIKDAQIVIIAVGTPSNEDGTPDLSQVVQAAEEIGAAITTPVIVVNKSTVPVGSGDLVANTMEAAGADPSLFSVVSNPEFLREGSAIKDSYNPDRIIIGASNSQAAEKLIELYKPLDSQLFVTDVRSAEMIKYASNSYLATKISYINAISRMCEKCGADVADVAHGMGMDKRIGPDFLKAGLGWGGSCFPKDVDGLIANSGSMGYDFGLLKQSKQVNEEQVGNFVSRIEKLLGGLKGKTVCVLGLSFKPNTDDIRDAKSLEVLKLLLQGGALIRAYDPVAMPATKKIFPEIAYAKDEYDAATGCDAIVLVTEWGQFKLLDLDQMGRSMRNRFIFDGRRMFDPSKVKAAGFKYVCIGSKSDLE